MMLKLRAFHAVLPLHMMGWHWEGLLVTEAAVVGTSSASAMLITMLSPCLPPSDCSSASVKKLASSLVIAGHFIKDVAQCKKVNKWEASPKTRLQPN